jgi:hypothetical protein
MIYLHNNRILSINSRYMDKYKENDNQGLKNIIERAITGKKTEPTPVAAPTDAPIEQ